MFTHTKRASRLRDCVIPKTHFLPDGILLSIGHFHNNFILLLLPEYFRVLPCWQIRAFVARITKNDYERENKE